MAVTVKAKIHLVILLTGITIFCLGICLLSAGIMIDHKKFKDIWWWIAVPYSQYWAGIPAIITGIILIAAAYNKESTRLKILSAILLLVSRVVTVTVVTELGSTAGATHSLTTICHKNPSTYGLSKEDCETLKELNVSIQILVISADILLVLCLVALLAIFADWILFTRKEEQPYHEQPRCGCGASPLSAQSAQPMTNENSPAYDVNPTGQARIQMVQLLPDCS